MPRDMGSDMGPWCLEHARRMDEHDRRLAAIESSQDRFTAALYGRNGDLGLTARIARMEETITNQRRVRNWLIAAVLTAVANFMTAVVLWALG